MTPRRLVAASLAIAAAYAAVHLVGWRKDVAILSGTNASVLRGIAYLVLHFAFWIAVPIGVLAAGILALVNLTSLGSNSRP